jgi:iduronate 2-sulfatase
MKTNVILLVMMIFLLFLNIANGKGLRGSTFGGPAIDSLNVLIIIANDLSLQLSCYDDEFARTPMLDHPAANGVLFERAYAVGTVCTPNRKSLQTGLNVKTVGWGNNNYIKDNPEVMTLPRYFREHGYQTVKIGSVAHTDDYEGLYDWSLNLNKSEVFTPGEIKYKYSLGSGAIDRKPVMRGSIYPDDQYTLDEVRLEAFERFIRQKWDRSKPFFFAFGFHSLHRGSGIVVTTKN